MGREEMKAWKVGWQDFSEGVWLVHAESPSKAKQIARTRTDMIDFDYEYVDLRAKRCPELDDLPLDIENAEKVLWFPDAIDEDGKPYFGEYCTREDYVNRCPCEICRENQ
jgi:hypothetical protein